MTDEENQQLLELHDRLRPFFRSRRFAEACSLIREKRTEALNNGRNEQASSLSGLLATCLTMDRRDTEALAVAREGEAIDPNRVEAKVEVARILLNFANEPHEAKRKAEEALRSMKEEHHDRYAALALLGTARARCGDIDGAIEIFLEMTSERLLNSLRASNYIGVFDLTVVEELVKAGAVRDECRRYLQLVASVPPSGLTSDASSMSS
jgi:hypothetical protein